MKTFFKELWISILVTIVLCIVVSGIYPVLIWAIGQLCFPYQANGSLIESDGKIVGSALLAQGFSGEKYFHPRPSAAGTGYDPLNSGGSNLGPTSQKLIDRIKAKIAEYRQENGLSPKVLIPADAVTASGSGLDPHISLQNAALQIPRVARARGLSEDAVREAVAKATDGPVLGLGGDAGVNVLKLNVALDAASSKEGLAEKKP
ncbi:MAG TPA: K(+)-transporting ATPase subunit C [Chthoniobacterales bacterium]|jgi:K+-transporting ATPase ATPase C chain|nr:K(+)-transporting ATPase subunit C [Chthoniobacterales bacterium]